MKKLFLFFTGLFCLLLTACSDLETDAGGQTGAEGRLSFSLYIPGSTINTYATIDATGGEDEVATLYALFFEPTTDGSGKFLELVNLSPSGAGNVYRSGQIVEIELPEGSVLSKAAAYNLLFMANPDYYLASEGGIANWKETLVNKTETEVKQMRVGIAASASDFGTSPYYQDHLMMSGEAVKEAGDDLIPAELTRIVSRFDVKNRAGSAYKLVSASIWNAFPDQIIWDEKYTDFTKQRIKRLYGITTNQDGITGGLYAYENYVASPQQNDAVTTCLILGIKYNGKVTYYRVNANINGVAQQLKRNNAYTFNILSVKKAGEDNEEDAYNSTENNLNVQINEWTIDDQGNIVIDGDNILALSTTNVAFDHDGGEVDLTIFAIGEGTLSISNTDLPPGFTVELNGKQLSIKVDPSEYDKTGYVELQFGKLKAVVNITQTGGEELHLDLNYMELPIFTPDAGQISDEVIVTSSGAWTAHIYNDQGLFQFEGGGLDADGNDQSRFKIITVDNNTDIDTKYAFVLVTLNADPEISRVLLISQDGSGQLDIDPDIALLPFDANGGMLLPSGDYEIEVTVEAGEDWDFTLYGAHAKYFTATRSDNNTGNKLTIASKGINPEAFELNAQVRIFMKRTPTTKKEILITQEMHTLKVTPTTFANIDAAGGKSQDITVTSTANWEATIEYTGEDGASASFQSGTTVINTSGGAGTTGLNVYFEELTTGGITPEAKVTFKIPGTNITQIIYINQSPLQGTPVNFQNSETIYGYLTTNNNDFYRTNYVEQLWRSINNTSYFGPNGEVFTGNIGFIDVARTPDNNTDIYVANEYNGTASQGSIVRNWLDASPNRVLLMLSDDRTNTQLGYFGFSALGYTGTGGTGNNVFSTDHPRTLNPSDNYTVDKNKLFEYLLKTGPFTKGGTEIRKDQIKLLPYDASNNCLTAWPSTMIPLILDPSNPSRLVVGVDPTLRLVYFGEMDLLTQAGVSSISYTEGGVAYTGAHNYSGGPYSEYNAKFINNLIAWMMEVVIKGDSFTNQFIQ